MRPLYLDVNEDWHDWARKIIIGNPYKMGCSYYLEGEGVKRGRYSCYEDYTTIPLATKEVR